MAKSIRNELQQMREALVKLAGTAELTKQKQLSTETLDKAAEEFKKLSAQSEAWITEHKFDKYFKDCHIGTGRFIREELGFENYFKRGVSYYYNLEDIKSLANELNQRNVDLRRYMELKADRETFEKKIALAQSTRAKSGAAFQLAPEILNITTSDIPAPPLAVIEEHLNKLMTDFKEFGFDRYIDIYQENYAMIKTKYHFDKYISSEIKSKCRKWCENFNYAHNAIRLIQELH